MTNTQHDSCDTGAATGACAQCGAPFRCGARAGDATCWCASLPALPSALLDADAAACLCPACLARRLAETGCTSGQR